jgi:hypothetical protein
MNKKTNSDVEDKVKDDFFKIKKTLFIINLRSSYQCFSSKHKRFAAFSVLKLCSYSNFGIKKFFPINFSVLTLIQQLR